MFGKGILKRIVETRDMETVSLSRSFEGDIDVVREAMLDLGPFMEAAGFDEVAVDGDEITITNHVGLLTIELELRCVETESVLAYEQVDGIFETMTTRYTLEAGERTVTVMATTDFALDVDVVGSILDGTIISRQRRKELTAQFDYLESVAADALAAE
jgi:uncharacterized Fe-S center protein